MITSVAHSRQHILMHFTSSYSPSQADVASFEAIAKPPAVENYPNAYRWYNHIKSFEPEFSALPGDPSKAYTTYGPEDVAMAMNPKDASKAKGAGDDNDDEMDLFGSDEEEEDPEVAAEREKRLAEYKKKKEGKAKPAAKSIVTLDVKPWGMKILSSNNKSKLIISCRRRNRSRRPQSRRSCHRNGRSRLG